MTPKLPCPRPARVVLEGRYARLEPLALAHAEGLMAASAESSSFDYLFDVPPQDLEDLKSYIRQKAASEDPLFHAVIDKATGVAGGRQTLMRITPEHGVIEWRGRAEGRLIEGEILMRAPGGRLKRSRFAGARKS